MSRTESDTRLEALSDGVFAIAMTLLIIDVKLPAAESVTTVGELWRALQHVAPAMFAFLLSFGVILITWVNHHTTMKMINGTSSSFIYANGFLLLTIVIFPFPTGLLGDFLGTDHAAPAVVLYNAVLAVQAVGWILLTSTALSNHLTTNDRAAARIRQNGRHGYFAVALYGALAVAALWLPVVVATVTTLSWIFWLVLGIRMKRA